ncbi:EndoU domain-containing protein [Cytobacillus purgationiresistens]|uniref:RsiW-degrading membrane proteinase PrsW (M82 family) n=1 Tax=Cytobacillus purgationiresistens TaxID=863449 RepID=A0ABU0AM71_9BACI|nr:EndoU domain-containing protein [Cytobacillus purgationiresistens]MDQ0271897.1 RsiW-degrading membrane proteinase PrsW (M82 family) [Cytobacillus purgationiresistens]
MVLKMRISLRNFFESIAQFGKNLIQKYPFTKKLITIFSWISIIVLVLSIIFMEDARKMFVQFFWSFYVLIQFWFLCRSKTFTWKKYTYFFLAGAWLIVPLNTFVVYTMTSILGGSTSDGWSMAFLTPISEEVLKLVPLIFYLFLSRRASTLSLTDYALIGAAIGAGFQFLEETARRMITGGLFDYGVTLFGGKVLHWDLFTLFPGYFEESFLPDKMTAGHPLLTAIITLGIGLAFRFKHKFTYSTFFFPLFLLTWAIFDHAIWNANFRAPDWLTFFHDLFGSGYAAKPLFLLMLCGALFIDYRDINTVRSQLPLLKHERMIQPFSEIWQLCRSFLLDKQRYISLLLFYRERREVGLTIVHGNHEAKELLSGLNSNMLKSFTAFVTLLLIGFTTWLLSDISLNGNNPTTCFACLFESLQHWWSGLSTSQKGMIILSAFALTFPLLGLWGAIGAVSTGIGLAESGNQIADIIRNPKKLLTPETALAAGLGFLLSRIPFGKLGSKKIKNWLDSLFGKRDRTPSPQRPDNNKPKPPKNNVSFKPGYKEHLVKVVDIVRKKGKGIVGGHNLEHFEKAFKDKGWDLDECIISRKKHPTIDGVYEIEYGFPKLDMEGKIIPGELKNVSHPKTVYDPKVISDEQIIQWGEEAMKNGTINGREIVGTSSNGLEFRGFINEHGEISNFFPTLD